MIKIDPPRSNDKIHLDQAWYRLIEAITTTVEPNSVATLAALAALQDVPNGNGRVVRSLKAIWMRDASSAAVADGITVIVSADGGRWIRQVQIDPTWASQATWYVNSVTGSDENDGATSGTALQTLSEFARRVKDQKLYSSATVWIEADCFLTDYAVLDCVGRVEIRGVLTQVADIVVDDWTKDINANNPGTLSLTGWTVADHLGRLVTFTDGPAANGYAWIVADLNGGDARVGMVVVQAYKASEFSATIVEPALGNTARIYSVPNVYAVRASIDTTIYSEHVHMSSMSAYGTAISYRSAFGAFSANGKTARLHNSAGRLLIDATDSTLYCGVYNGVTLKNGLCFSYSLVMQTPLTSITTSSATNAIETGAQGQFHCFGSIHFFGAYYSAMWCQVTGGNVTTQGVVGGSVTQYGVILSSETKWYHHYEYAITLLTGLANVFLSPQNGELEYPTFAQTPYMSRLLNCGVVGAGHSPTVIRNAGVKALTSSDYSVGIVGALAADATQYALQNLTASATALSKVMTRRGHLRHLVAHLGTAAENLSTVTVTVLKNGAVTLLTCTLSANETDETDVDFDHVTSFEVGDRIDIQVVTVNSGGFAAANLSVSVELS